MFDQLIGLVLLGLGIKTTLPGTVKGDTTVSATLVSTNREQFRHTIQAQKAQAVAAREAAHTQFQQKLTTIADARKKTIVTHADTKMAEINAARLDAWTNHLDKMSQILERVIAKAATAKAGGSDTASVDDAVAAAQQAIAIAQAAVTTQSSKQYTITIGAENALKTAVTTTTRSLKQDLIAVQQTITTARNAVHAAIAAVNALHSTPTPTP